VTSTWAKECAVTDTVPTEVAELVHRVYAAFNARDIDALVPVMSPGIDWRT
jgi:hypothetical protein